MKDEDPDGRYQALLTDQTNFYNSTQFSLSKRTQQSKTVGGVLDVVQTTNPTEAVKNTGTANINLVTAKDKVALVSGQSRPEEIVPEGSMPIYDPVNNDLIAYVTNDGPANHALKNPRRTMALGDIAHLTGTFKDTLKNVSVTGTADASLDASGELTVNVTSIESDIPDLDIELHYTGKGWSTDLFDKVQNAVANSNWIKDMVTTQLKKGLNSDDVRKEVSGAINAALRKLG